MSKYSVLHVSDVHFGSDNTNAIHRIAERLVIDARAYVRDNHLQPPDLCVFSGDLAQSGTEEQFRVGERWLRELTTDWGSRIFIVPGNHDLKRPSAPEADGQKKLKLDFRSAARSEKAYKGYRSDITKVPFMDEFFNWHAGAKGRLNLNSDWSQSRLACKTHHRRPGVDAVLIGVNTATLCFGDDDRGNLVADESALNEMFTHTLSDEQLIILISHHPIGFERNSKKQRWLAKWNAEICQQAILQSSGPQLYLHGHLHSPEGVAVDYTTGQNLALFGAGAAYDNIRGYPKRFAFYDIDLLESTVRPTVFEFDEGAGKWMIDGRNSRAVRAVLPRPKIPSGAATGTHLEEFKRLAQAFVQSHVEMRKILHESLPRVAPDLIDMLTPGAKRRLLKKQFQETHYSALIKEIEDIGNTDNGHLQEVLNLVKNGEIENAISQLQEKKAFPSVLLTARVLSENGRNWDLAEQMLVNLGRPFHYLQLGYSAWADGDLAKAQILSENALECFEKDIHDVQKYKIYNNLAYFYAEVRLEDKAQTAREFAHNAIAAVEDSPPEATRRANYLDTLGFVKISFALSRDEVLEGIADCEHARQCGADIALYFKHIRLAESKLSDLGEAC